MRNKWLPLYGEICVSENKRVEIEGLDVSWNELWDWVEAVWRSELGDWGRGWGLRGGGRGEGWV